jgi:thiol:disulfide interchange protein DsbD
MKRIFFFYLITAISLLANAQEDVVTWTTNFNSKTSELEIHANLSPGWHIFSQYLDDDLGPVATNFLFEKNSNYLLIDSVSEPKAIHKLDPNFETQVYFFEEQVIFKQKIKAIQPTILSGIVTYMACNEFQCIPPTDEKFTITITK